MARISSLEDLKKKQEKEEEEEKKENQYFAGGLDQRGGGSGLAVQAPPQGGGRPNPRLGAGAGGVGGDPHDLLHGIIDKASDPNNGPPPPSSSSSGGGRGGGGEPVVFEVALYRNGIIVNNGPFRDISNPDVQRFLTSLYRGEIPEELAQQMNAASASSSSTGGPREVDLKLTNKIEEDYVPPAYVAFSGVANSLGGGGSSNTEAFIFSNDLLRGIPVPVLDESQGGGGVINVQLRTHDNKRLKLRINGNITIAAFAALILKEIGGQGKAIRFILSAGFPPKDILDPTITVSEAGFAGAAITMKLA